MAFVLFMRNTFTIYCPLFHCKFSGFYRKTVLCITQKWLPLYGGCIVIQHNSEKLARHFVNQKWISADDYEWCVYMIEKKIYHYGYIFVLLMISCLIGSFCNTIVFLSVFCGLRRRIGGWHAPTPFICMCLSVLIILSVSLILEPTIVKFLPLELVFKYNILAVTITFMMEPFYPPCIHFEKKEIVANNKKKNTILLFVIIEDVIFVCFNQREFLSGSLLGILFTLILVLAEKIKQKGEEDER